MKIMILKFGNEFLKKQKTDRVIGLLVMFMDELGNRVPNLVPVQSFIFHFESGRGCSFNLLHHAQIGVSVAFRVIAFEDIVQTHFGGSSRAGFFRIAVDNAVHSFWPKSAGESGVTVIEAHPAFPLIHGAVNLQGV